MSEPGLTPPPADASKAFARSWTWRIAMAVDIAAAAVSAILYTMTNNVLSFAPFVAGSAYMLFVLFRFIRSGGQPPPPTDAIVR